MSDEFDPQPAQPVLRARRRLSPVWAIPIVAGLVAAWLAYTTFAERGPTIQISFRTGSGLEAGKTRVKHNDVELGIVQKVELSDDLSHVIVTAEMHKQATAFLAKSARFWVVRPRLSISNFSGLETLVSGAYVEMEPGKGQATRSFLGLEDPPVVRADVPGREFIITTERLGSIAPNTPIYFRSVRVGEVLGYEFSEANRSILIHAFVDAPYDKDVFDGSRFWNDSGISFSYTASGFKVQMESLQALLAGGISFDTPDQVRQGHQPSKDGAVFSLYPDHETVLESSYAQRIPILAEFDGSVHGLEVGAPVEFRGIKVGNVTEIHLEYDAQGNVRVPVRIEFEPQRVQRAGRAADEASPPGEIFRVLNLLVEKGMRAQLKVSSFLTGSLFVSFDFFPNSPPARITMEGKLPKFPTVPSDIETLTASLSAVASKVAALPLSELIGDIRGFIQSFKAITDDPALRSAIGNMNNTLSGADKTLKAAETTLKQLDTTLVSATNAYGGESQVRRELVELLRELQETARSVKQLADYVEQHPEAIIRGKGDAP